LRDLQFSPFYFTIAKKYYIRIYINQIYNLTFIYFISKDMSEFDDIIKRRKMVRQYIQDKPIPEEIVDKLIANAHRAPSAGHTQVQEFIIVQDRLIKEKLGEAALNQEQVYDAPLLIVVCANTSRSIDRYGKRGREFYSIIDGAFASMLILLTAVNEGIGACFVGAFLDDKVSEILELPEYVKPNRNNCIRISCRGS
jgi:nitroreductase